MAVPVSGPVPLRLGVVGLGKIARGEHVPAISANDVFTLVATADPAGRIEGVPGHRSLSAMLAAETLDAVAICTPPAARHALAREAIDAGLHVLLEKPPAATCAEAADLRARADAAGVSLFAAWHSREAAGVAAARAWLAARPIRRIAIVWREDIRRWHPGQEWILAPGGFGVFDPTINALSILTELVPEPIFVRAATLIIPDGRATPLSGTVAMLLASGGTVSLDLDFLQAGPQTWTITIETDDGAITLSDGGSRWTIDGPEGAREQAGDDAEYPALYARFAALIAARASDMDLRPLQLVADTYLVADLRRGPEFTF